MVAPLALTLEQTVLALGNDCSPPIKWSINKGEKVLLKGENGCGKSTFAETITGYKKATSGEIGRTLHTGYVSQKVWLPLKLTISDFLKQVEYLCDSNLTTSANQVIDIFGLKNLEHERIEKLSRGWQQRVHLAQAWIGEPTLLVLDEPHTALDSEGLEQLKKACKQSNAAILLLAPHESSLESSAERILNFKDIYA
jgi:ABC-type multidrug transport system ATPase subunit